MFIWMKLNGIKDTQSLIEEKARDANGNFFMTLGQSLPEILPKPLPPVKTSRIFYDSTDTYGI